MADGSELRSDLSQAVILWKTLVLPRLLYAVEAAVLGEAWPEADVVVNNYNCVSEVLQLPRRSPTTALVGELGVRHADTLCLRHDFTTMWRYRVGVRWVW